MRPTALPGRRSRHVEPADFGGDAQVRHLRAAFDLTRAALYKALCAKPKPAKERPGRKPSPTVISNARLLEAIEPLLREHPAWGHRKVWAMLRRWGILVARRRIWAIMHQAGLTFIARARRAEPRSGTVAVEQPNRRWCSDMTTVWTRKDDLGRADAGRRLRLSQRARDWDFQGSGRAGDLSTAGNCARGGIPRSARGSRRRFARQRVMANLRMSHLRAHDARNDSLSEATQPSTREVDAARLDEASVQ